MLARLARFFAPVPGSVAGRLSPAEIGRAVAASGVGSAILLVVLAALQALADHSAQIFPAHAALAASVIGLALELVRRLAHADAGGGPGA